MRAAVYDRYGGPEVLREAVIPTPTPTRDEVSVRVMATSVNGYDALVRSGALKLFSRRTFPQQTGLDFVGEVVASPAGSMECAVGDRVWGTLPLHRLGGAAEFVCVELRQIALSPAGLPPTAAAALPVVGATALIALRDIAGLRAGERILVRGASGGVGACAVQIATALDAHVTGLARGANLDLVRSLGAAEALDYRTVVPADLGSFDVILDTVGSDVASWRRLLAPAGRMVAIVPDPDHPVRSMAYFALSRIHGARRVRFFSAKPDTAVLRALADYVALGALKPLVHEVYPLSRVADAHRAFEAGGCIGKQIIEVD